MRGGPMVDSLDDAHWFDVARLELPDGRIARIQEAWIRLSPRYVCFYNKWDPGAITPRHGHHGDHSILIVKGHRAAKGGFGVRAGEEIVHLVHVRYPRGRGADSEHMAKLVECHGKEVIL